MDALITSAPFVFSGIAAILTAFFTNRRAKQSHADKTVFDKQALINETYEMVLLQVREELLRKDKSHDTERSKWYKKETELLKKIEKLETDLEDVRGQLRELKLKEERLVENQRKHLTDGGRHVERRNEADPPRLPETDLPT